MGRHTTPGSDDRFSLITVLYHSSAAAGEELAGWAAVVESMRDDVEWIVIDNSEDDEDARFFERFSAVDNIRYSRRRDNPGFALSCNFGASLSTSRWLVFLNPDIAPDVDRMRRVLAAVRADDDDTVSHAVGQITDGVRHQGICMLHGIWFSDRVEGAREPLIGPSGGFGVFPRSLFSRFEGFTEGLFAWGEDAELAIRMSEAGVGCRGIDEYFLHSGGHSFKADPSLRQRKVWLLARNRQVIAREHFATLRLMRFQLFTLCVTLAKVPVHLRHHTLGAVVKGNATGLGRTVSLGRLPSLTSKP